MSFLSEKCVKIRARSATVNSRTASASYLEKYSVVAIVAMSHGRIVSVCVASVGMTIGIAKEGVRLNSK